MIKETRRMHDLTGKKLRRARYLFIFLCRRKFFAYDDNYMDLFVEKAKEYGFYSTKSTDSDNRYHVLRRLYRIHNPNGISWHEWYSHYRWRCYEWKKDA